MPARRDHIYRNENRTKIWEIVGDRPSITPTELADQLGLSLSTVLYHIGVLEDHDEIVTVRRGRQIHCFTPEIPHQHCRAMAETSDDATRRVVRDVLSDPEGSARERADRLGVSRQAVQQQLRRLQRAGLLRDVDGGSTRWRVAEPLAQVVEEGDRWFPDQVPDDTDAP